MNFFITNLWENPRLFFAWLIIVVFSICCHEFAHAYIAFREGDPTAVDQGHLTFNPFKQMGIWSILMFILIGFAWGQVPVNPQNYRRRYSAAVVAASGPLTNLLLGLLFGAVTFLCIYFEYGDEFAWKMLFYGGVINMVMFILNMLPVPGFDGWVILNTFKPDLFRKESEWLRGTFLIVIILVFSFVSYLFKIGEFLIRKELYLLALLFE